MVDEDKNDETASGEISDKATKPAKQDVEPPEERVDDEVGSDEGTTTRQE